MKKYLTIFALLIVCSAHAQETRKYKSVETDHLDQDGHLKSKSTKYDGGKIYLSPTLIKIDEGQPKQQVYTIASMGKAEAADEGYTTKEIIILAPTKSGGLRAYTAVLLISPKGRVTDLVIKKTAKTHIAYTLD